MILKSLSSSHLITLLLVKPPEYYSSIQNKCVLFLHWSKTMCIAILGKLFYMEHCNHCSSMSSRTSCRNDMIESSSMIVDVIFVTRPRAAIVLVIIDKNIELKICIALRYSNRSWGKFIISIPVRNIAWDNMDGFILLDCVKSFFCQ